MTNQFIMLGYEFLDTYMHTLGPYALSAYIAIARHADADGKNAFPSYQTIAERAGMSRGKAIDAVKKLVNAGLVEKVQRTSSSGGTAANQYRILPIPPRTTDANVSTSTGADHE